eukprot:TRINITY_DN75857_c0_g1_i1.p1 TRINITY_DN75857_c0_g1~~TRINITY_DN75857_c0_g1_i1.p1  ORF type:complete len:407 (+),score=74.16 TRINITY_DN75857_c0_g1_i1:51-1271(+)
MASGTAPGGQIAAWTHKEALKHVSWGCGGKRLASVTISGVVQVFELPSSPVEPEHARGVQVSQWSPHHEGCQALCLAFESAGTRLAVGLQGGWARIFDVELGEELALLQQDEAVFCLAWHPSGKELATGDGSSARVFDTEAGAWRQTAHGYFQHSCVELCWNSAGDLLAGAISDGTARVCERGTWVERCRWKTKGPVLTVTWHPSENWLASGSKDGSVRIFDVESDVELLRHHHAGPVYGVGWSPGGGFLASCGQDGTVRVFGGGGVVEIACLKHLDRVTAVHWHPSGQWLAAVVRGEPLGEQAESPAGAVHVYGARFKWAEIARFDHQDTSVASMAWAMNGEKPQLATCAADNALRIFDLVRHVRAANWHRGRVIWRAHSSRDSGSHFRLLTPDVLRKICSFLVL